MLLIYSRLCRPSGRGQVLANLAAAALGLANGPRARALADSGVVPATLRGGLNQLCCGSGRRAAAGS